MQNNGDPNNLNFELFQILGRLGVTAAGYPFEYVKVLIQIGHEPLPPMPTHTLFGRPAFALPGVFTYMKHIRKIDGFWGLYRGLFPKLCTNLVSMSTFIVAYEKAPLCTVPESLQKPEKDLTQDQKVLLSLIQLKKTTIARTAAIVVSHPFHIITIRTIAQFVGREEKYGSLFGSLFEIFNQDGILGFFSGLVPRLLGELMTLWTASIASILINTYIIEEESLKGYVTASMNYLAAALFYPFQVVSSVTIANNCGLKAGIPPNMPIYLSWNDCASHLRTIGQLKRGSSLLWRYYSGPYLTRADSMDARNVHSAAFPHSINRRSWM